MPEAPSLTVPRSRIPARAPRSKLQRAWCSKDLMPDQFRRLEQKGWPAGGWYPGQKLTLAEAIRGFTKDAAYAAFEEKSRRTIEPGKLADLTIIEGDLFSMPQAELFKARVRYTVVGGEIVYGAVTPGSSSR